VGVHALADDRVRFLGGLWDQELLDQLYAGAATYLHGHSVGGTNPSLLRAIGAGAATLAYDVVFNREVLGSSGRYFRTAEDVAALVTAAEADPDGCERAGELARTLALAYDWDDVADRYEALLSRLVTTGPLRSRPSGRRRAVPPVPEPQPPAPAATGAVPTPRADQPLDRLETAP
jgi:glycosyltransferase involved in cell wall biosynthesis